MLIIKNPHSGQHLLKVELSGEVELDGPAVLRVLEALKGSALGQFSTVQFGNLSAVRGDLVLGGALPGATRTGAVHVLGITWPPCGAIENCGHAANRKGPKNGTV